MITIQKRHSLFEKLGLGLVVAQLFLFIFGLPPFQAGFWFQTEPTMVAMFALATANAGWLACGWTKNYLSVKKPDHLWKCLLLWVGWQLLVMLSANSYWRSWFGPAEIAEGTGWYVGLLLCTLLCSALWRIKPYRQILLLSACLSIFIQSVLHWINFGDPTVVELWRPARWPDYLAFMIGYLWIALAASGYCKRPALLCLFILFVYLVLYISSNMTATILIALAMLAATIMPYPRWKNKLCSHLLPNRFWRSFMAICCLLPMLWIGFSAGAPYFSLDQRGDIVGTLSDNDDSMGARVLLARIGLIALKNEPRRLLIGAGWGNFSDDSYKYALVDGVHAYKNGIRKPNAMHVHGSAFHSHVEPLEILLSLGIIGLILWFAFPLAAIRRLPDSLFWHTAPMIVALICLYYFWFVLPQVLAFQAIAFCALCAAIHPADSSSPQNNLPKYTIVPLLAIMLLMGWSATAQYKAMRYGDEIHFIPRQQSPASHHTDWIKEDIKRGGERLRAGGENFSLWGWNVHNGKETGDYDIEWHNHFLAAAKEMESTPQAGVRSQMLLLWMYYKLLLDYGDDKHGLLRSEATRSLEASIMQLTRIAPQREDIAAPFLKNLPAYTKGNIADYVEILVKILKIYPEHRSALWLLGHMYLTEPLYAAEGEQMIRRAVAAGVEHIHPITKEELRPWLGKNQAVVKVIEPAETNESE